MAESRCVCASIMQTCTRSVGKENGILHHADGDSERRASAGSGNHQEEEIAPPGVRVMTGHETLTDLSFWVKFASCDSWSRCWSRIERRKVVATPVLP